MLSSVFVSAIPLLFSSQENFEFQLFPVHFSWLAHKFACYPYSFTVVHTDILSTHILPAVKIDQ